MDRFTIQRKISDTLLGATYECSFNQPRREPTATPRKPRASVAIKRSSLATREQLLLSEMSPYGSFDLTLDDPLREREVVAKLIASGGHANVLQCYDHFTAQAHGADNDAADSVVCFVTEYCNGGDLFSYLATHNSDNDTDRGNSHNGHVGLPSGLSMGLGERHAVSLTLQVARGLAFLHATLGLAHRDLSLENVLLRNGTCKLADFGLAVPVAQRCHGQVGKRVYMAPEVAAACDARLDYDPASADVWSLGVVLFMLLTGSPLVDVASREDPRFMALVGRGVGTIVAAWGVEASSGLVELLEGMLSEDPKERPTIALVTLWLERMEAEIGDVPERQCCL